MLQVRLLGTFEVEYDHKTVTIASRPAQSLFAYLILSAGTSHRREKIAGLLWPDSTEETARDYLRHALWRIRKALGPATSTKFLHTDDLTVRFDAAAPYRLDVLELEKADERASADELIAVLSAYQGELLPGFYDEWTVLEREHVSSIFEHHMARLLSVLQDERRWSDVLDWGERWIKLGQKPEPAYRALMAAHASNGDLSAVAASYERCVKALREFGIEPSEQTRELYESLKAGKAIPAAGLTPTRVAAKGAASNIPVPLTSFVGRGNELKEIARLLSTSRLLTLTGAGGVGKTRLAIQAAQDAIRKYKDGVYWVGLVGLADAELIPQEIAQALDIGESTNEPIIQTLKTHLKTREVLLVLDNCEHLIKACAQVAEQLLAACPKLKILATSLEALGLFNEMIWQVPSLPLPETQRPLSVKELRNFASVELFDDRASNAKPGFALDERSASAVAQICRRLDGIPLAIELAAARSKVLSVDEIAARLDDRFSLLTAGSRTAIPRHQTLRATLDWSYDLLTEAERVLLRRLSVFAGGFTLEAAEVVCGKGMEPSHILDLLSRLVDKSLVIVEADSGIGRTLYRLLETIRQYALEKMVETGEATALRDRHLGFYLNLAEQSERNIPGKTSAIWFRRMDKELDNIRAAMEWSTSSGKAVAALQLAGSLVYFWFAHGLPASEWSDRMHRALERPEGRERTLARAKALNGIGFMYWADMYPTSSRPELEEALSIGKEFNDKSTIATALRNLGTLENIQGNFQEARSFLEQSLETWREMGPEGRMGSAQALLFLGDVALNHAEAEWARSLYAEAIMIVREVGDLNYQAYTVRRLGQLAWREGDYEKAIPSCRESLQLNLEVRDLRGVIACLAGFADIAVGQGKLARAAQLMAAVESQLAAIGIRLLFIDRLDYEPNLAGLRAKLNEKTFNKFWAKGQAMSLEQAIAFALEEG